MGVRHNILREVLLHFCLLGGFQAEREVPGLLRGSGDRPADVLLSIANALGSKSCCLDIAVTHTQQISILSRASVEPGAAAAAYESKVKLRRYAAVCAANGLEFVPMVVDVFGAWGPSAGPILSLVSRALAFRGRHDSDTAGKYLRQHLSFALQRANANTLLHMSDPTVPDLSDPAPLPARPSPCSAPGFPGGVSVVQGRVVGSATTSRTCDGQDARRADDVTLPLGPSAPLLSAASPQFLPSSSRPFSPCSLGALPSRPSLPFCSPVALPPRLSSLWRPPVALSSRSPALAPRFPPRPLPLLWRSPVASPASLLPPRPLPLLPLPTGSPSVSSVGEYTVRGVGHCSHKGDSGLSLFKGCTRANLLARGPNTLTDSRVGAVTSTPRVHAARTVYSSQAPVSQACRLPPAPLFSPSPRRGSSSSFSRGCAIYMWD